MAVCAERTEFLTKIGENRGIVLQNWLEELLEEESLLFSFFHISSHLHRSHHNKRSKAPEYIMFVRNTLLL